MSSPYEMIPSDKLLPMPSILEKLKEQDDNAAIAIFSLSDEIAAEAERISTLLLKVKKPWSQFFAEGLSDLFNPKVNSFSQMLRGTLLTEAQSLNFSWAQSGNNLRRAIRQYMEDHPGVAAQVELTEEETESLKAIPLWVSAAKAEFLNRLPKDAQGLVVERLDLAFHA